MSRPSDTSIASGPAPETVQTLQRMINGYMVSQALYVAARLGLADLVAAGPKPPEVLAEATGTHAPSLYRLLRALASVGVFAEDDQGRFGLTALGSPLRSDAPVPLGGWAVFSGDPENWRAWGDLMYSVTTGGTAFAHVWGMPNWEYRAKNPAANAVFNAAMTSVSMIRASAVLDAYDFSQVGVLADIGGGHGAFLSAALTRHPTLRGLLFDLPHVVADAPSFLAAVGVASRCQVVGGDFFAAAPTGADVYLLSKVLHDWGDEPARAILARCHAAMRGRGRLLLVEAVVPPGNTPHPSKLADLHMLVGTEGGRERTGEEWQALLASVGFSLTRIVPTRGDNSVLEAVPV